MVRVFEKPLHPGWVYPCTVEEIEQQLRTFPPEDLEGLAVICLVPVIRKDLEDPGVGSPIGTGRVVQVTTPADALPHEATDEMRRRVSRLPACFR